MKLTAIAFHIKTAFKLLPRGLQHSHEVLRQVLPKTFDFGGLKLEPGDEVALDHGGRRWMFKVPGGEDIRILLTKRAVDHLHAELRVVGRA